jgi:hypothetical protein
VPDQAVRWAASNGKVRPGLIAARMPQGGQGLGTGSSRTRMVDQGSALHPACACPTHPERHDDQHRLVQPAPDRDADQRLRWSAPVWSPPPESNRRPHPETKIARTSGLCRTESRAWLDMLSDSHPSWRPRPWGSYQQSRAYRYATLRFCRSRATVRGEVMRSPDPHPQPNQDASPWATSPVRPG